MKVNENLEIDFFVGIDMPKEKFDVGVLDNSGVRIAHKKLKPKPPQSKLYMDQNLFLHFCPKLLCHILQLRY